MGIKGTSIKIDRICQTCNREFFVYPKYAEKGYGKYCSRKCYGKSLKGYQWTQEAIDKRNKHKMSEETRKKRSLSQTGSKGSNWKGGITPLHKDIRTLLEYCEWRKKVFERDNYTCQDCFEKGIALHPHHKKAFHQILKEFLQEYNQFSPVEDKETLIRLAMKYIPFWDISNGITLCEDCHKLTRVGVKSTGLKNSNTRSRTK